MKYEITFRVDRGEGVEIIEADNAVVYGGTLSLTSGVDPDKVVHAIFADWKRIVEVKE